MRLERQDDVTILRMQAGKANAMSEGQLRELDRLIDEAFSLPGALVVTGYERFFSAGLALPSLVELERPAMREFIELFGRVMRRVFELPGPVVAALNGHAIAGGCVLAFMCDVRLAAAGSVKIGLNEVQLGIGLPAIVVEPVRIQVPPSSLLPVCLEGKLFAPEEALRLGVVHEVVPAEALEARALARARELAAIPRAAWAQVKAALRRPTLDEIDRRHEAEAERWLDTWFSPAGQERLRAAVASLR
jgi:enoyl-CoA hydratase